MHKKPEDLYAFLGGLGIPYETLEHAPVFTATDEISWGGIDGGVKCKNLFVENKEGQRWLVTLPSAARADMNAIGKQLNSGRLSFVPGEHMLEAIGVPPGHATPFAFLNDCARAGVRPALDEQVAHATRLSVHPLVNSATIMLSGADLMRFFRAFDLHPPIINACKAADAA